MIFTKITNHGGRLARGGGLARSWAQTVTRASGGGELCLVVVAQQSAEGFGVQHAEVQETGGEPASAEWIGATGYW